MNRRTATLTLSVLLASNTKCTSAFLSPSLPSSFILPASAHATSNLKNRHVSRISPIHMSSTGDGNDNNNNNNNNNNNSNGGNPDGNLDDFLDPRKASEESENLKKARAALSEDALPINFDTPDQVSNETSHPSINSTTNAELETDTDTTDHDDADAATDDVAADDDAVANDDDDDEVKGAGLLVPSNGTSLANNPYLNVVSKLSPSDLISKFTSTAHPRVQDAVRSTILGLIGTIPKMAFETTTITTGEKLASLMFQLQMTGYMFKNAEYRLSLSQSLGDTNQSGTFLLEQSDALDGDDDDDDDDNEERLSSGKVKGKIKVRYETKRARTRSEDGDDADDVNKSDDDDSEGSSLEVEVDAAAYMAELRNEVSKLREELSSTREAKEEGIRNDLLLYIRTLPQQELNTLTNTMSDDILGAMKGLVNVVMGGIGEGQIDKNTVTEQSGEAMAQLCMWQLVVGYNLRELEVREEMKKSLISGSSVADSEVDDDTDSPSIDFEGGGFE